MADVKADLIKQYLKVLRTKNKTALPTIKQLESAGMNFSSVRYHFGALKYLEIAAYKVSPNIFPEGFVPGEKTDFKKQALENYIKLRRHLGRMPTQSDLQENKSFGISADQANLYFKGIANLDQIARETSPETFHDVSLSHIRTPRRLKEFDSAIKKHRRFFITTSVVGCKVNMDCLASAKSFCEKRDAVILNLISFDSGNQKTSLGEEALDRRLTIDPMVKVVLNHTKLNSNFHLSTVKVSAKQFDPLQSMEAIGRRDGSMVYASPKQRLKTVPVGQEKYAHVLQTTGAITEPNYHSTKLNIALRTAEIAEEAHVMGGLIVEIEDDNTYYARHVQFDESGAFIDLGVQYLPNGKTRVVNAEGIMTGDWHTGDTDPQVKAATKDMFELLKPKYGIFQDFHDGKSTNHHEEKDKVQMALNAEKGLLSIRSELEADCRELDEISNFNCKVLVMIYSNHDDFLKRYVKDCNFRDNHANKRILCQLTLAQMDGHDPIPFGIETILGYKYKKKVIWLKEDEDFIIAGINHVHGHIGRKGSRNPPTKSLARDYGLCNSGHTHDPEIFGPAFKAGTSTPRKLEYMKGPNSCLQAHIVTYPNGSRQLLIIVAGRYHLDQPHV